MRHQARTMLTTLAITLAAAACGGDSRTGLHDPAAGNGGVSSDVTDTDTSQTDAGDSVTGDDDPSELTSDLASSWTSAAALDAMQAYVSAKAEHRRSCCLAPWESLGVSSLTEEDCDVMWPEPALEGELMEIFELSQAQGHALDIARLEACTGALEQAEAQCVLTLPVTPHACSCAIPFDRTPLGGVCSTSASCELGTSCVGLTSDRCGRCELNLEPGAVCDGDVPLCTDGYWCRFTAGAPDTCVPLPINDGNEDVFAAGDACEFLCGVARETGLRCVEGVCKPIEFREVGEPCDDDDTLALDCRGVATFCAHALAGGTAICQARPRAGEHCVNSTCDGRFASCDEDSEVCLAHPSVGDRCEFQCGPGAQCQQGLCEPRRFTGTNLMACEAQNLSSR